MRGKRACPRGRGQLRASGDLARREGAGLAFFRIAMIRVLLLEMIDN